MRLFLKRHPLRSTYGNRDLEALARFTLCKSLAGLMRKIPKSQFGRLDRLIPSFPRFYPSFCKLISKAPKKFAAI